MNTKNSRHPSAFDLWEKKFREKIASIATSEDPAHDLLHFERVVESAKRLCMQEQGRLSIVIPAAWLHDFVIVPKDSPMRSQASKMSALGATKFLAEIGYPSEHLDEIAHAIEAHSFSAQLKPTTIEAKIVQDADRLDGLGAIGIARCFATAGLLGRSFYNRLDPFCQSRTPNDAEFTIDHFYKKLFLVAETLQTQAGRTEGQRRVLVMQTFLKQLSSELCT